MRKTYVLLLFLLLGAGITVKASPAKFSSIPPPVLGITLEFNHPELAGVNSGDTLVAECGFATVFTVNDVLATTDCPGGATVVFQEVAFNINNCTTADYLYWLQCTWIATDACGNQAEIYIVVKVVDTTPPTISNVPPDLTVDMTAGQTVPPPGTISAFDPCGNFITQAFSQQFEYDGCTTNITRTWAVTDRCGNSTSDSQEITVLTGCDCEGPEVLTTYVSFPCDGVTGSITVVTANPALYQYTWSPDIGTPEGAGNLRSDLPPGTYTITLTDPLIADCSTVVTATVEATTIPVLTGQDSQNPLNCLPNGSISIQASGIPAPEFRLNGGPPQSSGNFSGLAAGNYQVVASNSCGETTAVVTLVALSCTDTVIITLPPDTMVEVCLTPVIDFVDNIDTIYVCDESQAGTEVTVIVDSPDSCLTIITTDIFTTIDTLCIVACSDPGNCDTTIIIIVPPPPVDTCQEPAILSVDFQDPLLCNPNGSITVQASGNPAPVYSLNGGPAQNTGFFSGLAEGNYQVVASNTCGTTTAAVILQDSTCTDTLPCPDLFSESFFDLETTDCAGGAPLCVPITLENYINFYEIIDNGIPFSGGIAGCDYDSMFAYTYYTLIGQGSMGPYHLDSWTVNGQTFSGDFADIDGLIALMNQADPAGNWYLHEITLNILGGSPGSDYSGLHITHPATGAMAWLEININVIPFGTELSFSEGEHLVFINNLSTGCADTITVFVTCTNPPLPPVAVDDNVTTDLNVPVVIEILANDIPNGTLTDTGLLSDPFNGTTVLNGDGTVTYTPNPDFCGADGFQYFICNGVGCDSAWVFLDVDCGNGGGDDLPPVAVDDDAATNINSPVIVVVLANDTLNGTLANIGIVSDPAHGTTAVNGNGTVTYSPALDFCGADSFQYFICNNIGCDSAWVFLDVDCGNGGGDDLPPVAVDDDAATNINSPVIVVVLANDTLNGTLANIGIVTDPAHGTTAVNGNGTVTYSPALNFCGADSFQYFICNNIGCDSAWVFLDVDCGNGGGDDLPPVAVDDDAATNINSPVIVVVLANDTLNGTLANIGIVTDPVNGMTAVNGNGTVTYSPALDFCGADSFQYFICNNIGCDSAWVFLDVDCGNGGGDDLPPVAVDDDAATNINSPVIVVVLANDTLNGTLANIGIVTDPVNGTTAVNGNGTVTYSPALNFCGADSFQYFICNPVGCDSAWVFLDVDCGSGNGDLPPIAVADSASVEINEPEIVVVLANDTLNGTLTDIGIVTDPENGLVVINGNGTVTYTPDQDFCGMDSFEYFICNNIGCDTAWVYLDVDCGEGPDTLLPIAVVDIGVTEVNFDIVIPILENDTINGVLQGIYIVTQPEHGVAFLNQDNDLLFAPEVDYCGEDTMIYAICNQNGCDTALVLIYVTCLQIYNGFSPNDDDVNDFFVIDGIDEYPFNTVTVFNRWGTKVFSKKDYRNDWAGTWEGKDLPDGTYYYYFDTGEGELFVGYLQIHR